MEPYLGENLIFLISQPRSGSTMLQRVLAGHDAIQTTAETWLMLHPVYSMRDHGIETEYNSAWRKRALLEFLEHYADSTAVYDDAIRAYAQVLYNHVLQRSGRVLFLDKTPRYFFIIPDLYRLFPKARFVFLLRNPLAILNSELSTFVRGNWKILARYRPDLVDAPALIRAGMELLGDQGHVIRYETFVQNPEAETEALCRYLGIDMQPGMVDYSATPAPKGSMNDPTGIHRRSRPAADSTDTWKTLGDTPQSRHFAHACLDAIGGDTLAALGYDINTLKQTLGPAPDPTDPSIYPWALAVEHRNHWTPRQHFRELLYDASARYPRSRLLTRLGACNRWIRFYLKRAVAAVTGQAVD